MAKFLKIFSKIKAEGKRFERKVRAERERFTNKLDENYYQGKVKNEAKRVVKRIVDKL